MTAVARPQEAQHKHWWADIGDDERRTAMVNELFDLVSNSGTKQRGKDMLYAWLWPKRDKEEDLRSEESTTDANSSCSSCIRRCDGFESRSTRCYWAPYLKEALSTTKLPVYDTYGLDFDFTYLEEDTM